MYLHATAHAGSVIAQEGGSGRSLRMRPRYIGGSFILKDRHAGHDWVDAEAPAEVAGGSPARHMLRLRLKNSVDAGLAIPPSAISSFPFS